MKEHLLHYPIYMMYKTGKANSCHSVREALLLGLVPGVGAAALLRAVGADFYLVLLSWCVLLVQIHQAYFSIHTHTTMQLQ